MSDHKHGEMEIKTQTETYDAFVNFGKWFGIFVIVLLILMAMFII